MAVRFIQWDEAKMSVNIEEIDKQHQALLDLISNLATAVKTGRSNRIFDNLMTDLLRYAELHFAAEEDYFREYQYPEAAGHQIKHKEFINKIQGTIRDLHSGKSDRIEKVPDFLRGWLVDHIMGMDKDYSYFFNQRGLR